MSVNPAEHGIIEHFDYFKIEKLRQDGVDEQGSVLEGKAFWDVLSSAGKRVALINPFSTLDQQLDQIKELGIKYADLTDNTDGACLRFRNVRGAATGKPMD